MLDIRNKYTIRDYRNDDYHGVSKFWELTEMGSPERGDTDETIRRTIELGGCLLVLEAKSNGRICGTSWMTIDGRRILLHHFGVLPECQGRGLSKILMNESLQYVKKKGLQVKIEVHSTNFKAINLYKKFGFVHLGDYNVYVIRDISNL
jgi:ribosomal protein S18 acetylase RimI-like enzyme